MQEKYWYLKNCRLLERLEPSQLAWLESRSRFRKFPKNATVYLPSDQSDGVMLLASGQVKICNVTADGKQSILTFVEPGDVFGELSLFDSGQREEFARTTESTQIILMPAESLRKVAEENPYLAMRISRLVGMRRKQIERRLKYLLFHSNQERLIHLLLELSETYGKSLDNHEVEIGIKLSHQDLAGVIGSTRESVTLILGELQADGLIRTSRRKIVLLKIQALADSIRQAPPTIPESPRVAWSVPPRIVGNEV